ncbi:hypothetical protein EJ05DRAFT_500712 [Pseudovirgaria hyperparasitica]|uniref:Uncharacterized protein n=1 Tax=Pseudovirgaria hyperparasitica TaxID=470096 RepID=A0A6A6W6M7_9PEZI|nr:uncharacterized protein EJ05DRAFT_500712 [Pseudovirgaria hyperparasitica]KAF2758195.1 hypothetical protein EJ05DRAFT_500712 [Pseudovirgaria hyperparasitica]
MATATRYSTIPTATNIHQYTQSTTMDPRTPHYPLLSNEAIIALMGLFMMIMLPLLGLIFRHSGIRNSLSQSLQTACNSVWTLCSRRRADVLTTQEASVELYTDPELLLRAERDGWTELAELRAIWKRDDEGGTAA